MRRKNLKRTELVTSVLCLGLSQLGLDAPERESGELLDRFIDAGGNFVDAARVYSDWEPGESGRCERIFGDYLRSRRNRDRFVICTKGGHFQLEAPEVCRVNPAAVMADLEASLKALGTDRIDLYLLHRDNPAVPVETLLETLDTARRQGKILEYGVSNWSPERIREATVLEQSGAFHGLRVDQEMINFGSGEHNALPEPTMRVWSRPCADAIRDADCAVMAFSGQAGGFFQKVANGVDPARAGAFYDTPGNRRRAEQLAALSAATGIGVGQLVLLYLLQAKTLQIFPIVRCGTPERLDETLKVLEWLDEPVDFGSLRDFE